MISAGVAYLMVLLRRLDRALLLVLAAALVAPASAQDWPARTVTIIVPSAPGDGSDIVARLFGEHLQRRLGQNFVVDNKSGAGGVIGTSAAAKAAPDGYTFIMGNAGSHGINAAIYPKLPYDVERDFSAVSLIFSAPNIFVANPALGVKTLADLVARLKAAPEQLNYASGGVGSSAHLNSEYLKLLGGALKAKHIAYRGASPALVAVASGEVQFMAVNLPPAMAFVRDGRLVPLAVTSTKRTKALPEVPTVAEAAFPGYEALAWFGLLAPAGTPPATIARLEKEVAQICRDPEIIAKLENLGGEAACIGAAEFKQKIAADIRKWKDVADAARIVAE